MRADRKLERGVLLVCVGVFGLSVPWAIGQTAQPNNQTALLAATYRFPLSQEMNGTDGYLELRQDRRLTRERINILWGTGEINIDDDPALAIFKSDKPRNAVIEIVDQAGKILESRVLERPLAKLRTVHLYEDSRPTYLLTVDYSAGFGSYSGPITSLWEVTSGHMRRVKSTDVKTGQTGDISLMKSLKTTWKFIDSLNGKRKQILFAQCRPDWSSVKDDPDFTTTYARFYFDGARWVVIQRKVKGLTEFDQGSPSRKNFP